MKKKLLGIIMTLVVMTIIPIAVFAAEPSLSASGATIDSSNKQVSVQPGKNINVTVAVGGNVIITANDTDESISCDNPQGAVSYTGGGKSITITGEKTGKATVNGKDLVCNITVVEKEVTDINISGTVTTMENGSSKTYSIGMSNNLDFFVGDTFEVKDGTVYYNNLSSNKINLDDLTETEAAFTAGDREISFTYEERGVPSFTKTYPIHVVAHKKTVVGVERDEPSSGSYKDVYYSGESFDFSTIKLKIQEDGTNETKYAYYRGANDTGFTAREVIMSPDNDEFVIRYDNEDYKYTFSLLNITTVSFKTVTPGLVNGAKKEYVIGENFNFSDLVLNVVEGTKKYKVDSTGFEYSPYKIKKNDNKVEVVYDKMTYTITLEDLGIIAYDNLKPIAIEYSGVPEKTDYVQGQVIDNWTGLTFTITYDNGTTTSKRVLPKEEYGNLVAEPFAYSDTYTDINSYAIVAYKEGGYTLQPIKVYGFKVSPRQVESIEVTKAPNKVKYSTGDTVDLTGMEITLTYNNKETEVHSYADPNFTCTPAHGEKVTGGKISVVYKDGNITKSTEYVGITVDNTPQIKTAILSKSPEKTTYEVGEKFNPKGMEVTLVFADTVTENYIMKDTAFIGKVNVTFNSKTNTKVTITVSNPYDTKKTATVTVPVTVTEKVVPSKIEATGYKSEYLVGEVPELEDITSLKVTMSDNTTLDKKAVEQLIKDKTATFSMSPSKITSRTKEVTISFKYKETTVTDTYKISAVEPVCVLYGVTTKPYASFELALEDANDLTTSEAKKVTITLNSNVEVSSKYSFNAERTIIIDLKGNNLTVKDNQLIVPHKSAYKDVEIVILNSSNSDAKLIYPASGKNEARTLVLGRNDEIVIDYETEIAGIYEITIKAGDHGKITGPTEVAFGNDAKYTITPDEGYEILEVFIDKKSQGKKSTVTIENVDKEHEVAASFKEKVVVWENPFTDIYKSASYYSAIEFVYENNLFRGMSTTKFEPNTTMTRAMFITVLGRLAGISENDSRYAGKSSFSDITSSAATSWYIPYVEWASSNGLVLGYEDGTFRPNREISHQEMYILMERYARNMLGITGSAGGTSIRATDTSDIPTWDGAYESVQFASKYDFLVLGAGNRITPSSNAMRYELAVLLESFCKSFGLLQETSK